MTTKIRRAPLAKAKGLLKFHRDTARRLASARQLGHTQTTASYRAQLLHNARVLRSKLLFKNDGTRF